MIRKKLFLRNDINQIINQKPFIMRKLLLFLSTLICFHFTVQAGYVIRGISTGLKPANLKNYTLALNEEGEPVSAASMHTASAPGTGKNGIVIIQANFPVAYLFPINASV